MRRVIWQKIVSNLVRWVGSASEILHPRSFRFVTIAAIFSSKSSINVACFSWTLSTERSGSLENSSSRRRMEWWAYPIDYAKPAVDRVSRARR